MINQRTESYPGQNLPLEKILKNTINHQANHQSALVEDKIFLGQNPPGTKILQNKIIATTLLQ